MKKALITGVAGFIGSKVATRFVAEGYEVYGVDDLSGGKRENIPIGIHFIQADLSIKKELAEIPEGCNLILHLAGQSSGEISFDDPVSDLAKNTISTLNLIDYGIRNQSEKILYASSMSVYGDVPDEPIKEVVKPMPLSCYGVSKLASEGYLKAYQDKLKFIALRMFNVYGPGQDLQNMRQGMVSIFLAQAVQKGLVEVKGSINRFRDFIYIDDVVEAWYRAAVKEEVNNSVINLGTGTKTTVQQLLDEISNKVPGMRYTTSGSTPGDQKGIYPDVSLLRSQLGMENFVTLSNGITQFTEWAEAVCNNNEKSK